MPKAIKKGKGIMTAVSLLLPDDISVRLQRLAEQTGQSETFYIVKALQEHLDDLEDIYLAETRWKNLQSGHTHTVPLDEVMQRYGLDD
jgi:RHH-type rel operon transcriptional repressor/antitoxin RelB